MEPEYSYSRAARQNFRMTFFQNRLMVRPLFNGVPYYFPCLKYVHVCRKQK